MKYTVKIADTSYEVEIEDILARPVIARVDGETFEVHPENGHKTEIRTDQEPKELKVIGVPGPAAGLAGSSNELTAPLPGTVVEIFVKKGEDVDTGHVIIVIEAMKMKNSIRSTRSGRISEVLVAVGQTVAHKQPLVRFE
jgi:glutaconyl-CoA/methylmalonyl-CoA decarboxylase subunit gamma